MKIKDLGFMNRLFGKRTVHVEAPHIFGSHLTFHAMSYKLKCYCLSPNNFEYINSHFGVKESQKELGKIMSYHYLRLKKIGADLQLHVHISQFPQNVSYKKKEKMVTDAYNFFVKELGIVPKEIVFGWYARDKDCEEIANKLNLKIIDRHFHIYDFWLK